MKTIHMQMIQRLPKREVINEEVIKEWKDSYLNLSVKTKVRLLHLADKTKLLCIDIERSGTAANGRYSENYIFQTNTNIGTETFTGDGVYYIETASGNLNDKSVNMYYTTNLLSVPSYAIVFF